MVAQLIEGWNRLQLPHRTILNVNVPDMPLEDIRGFHVARLGHRNRAKDVLRLEDPRGRQSYWIGIAGDPADAGEGTDFHATQHGMVSITPLQIDLTHQSQLAMLKQGLA